MSEINAAPVLFFAPFVSSRMRIEPGWIDYNGHLNLAYYHVLLDRAMDEAFGLIGLGAHYLAQRRASYFLAECHTRFLRELMADASVRVTVHLVDFDEKTLHYRMEIRDAAEGWVAATAECVSVHVDMDSRRPAPFPADILANLSLMKASHARLPRPRLNAPALGVRRRNERREDQEPALAGTRH